MILFLPPIADWLFSLTNKSGIPLVRHREVRHLVLIRNFHNVLRFLIRINTYESFCAANGWTYEIIQDLGSGLNYNKKGLQQLIKRICSGQVGRLVLTHQDRLLRFGSELVFALCETYHTEVVMINQGEQPLSFEEELAQDVLEIITVFSARLYGSRSHKNRKLVETLRGVAEQL
jgi:predicted site-specific integrase-resolvase